MNTKIYPYKDFTKEEFDKIVKDVFNSPPKRSDFFEGICYCSHEQYINLETWADVLHIACLREMGKSEEEVNKEIELEKKLRREGKSKWFNNK